MAYRQGLEGLPIYLKAADPACEKFVKLSSKHQTAEIAPLQEEKWKLDFEYT
ncbi:hypothetical protein PAXINDRAFT_17909 [Paxillus involutus ATCC 200175]|uniref:Uncharacterized protein n=1 Tax=Paxillus involutus ATCC 200175 TaxID=664439 RepID=A0A0C9SPH7_PAXIN|nr:hypothetical protein PAXINDRAFT_17909 [Paxillus involutus ATCC 200175]